MEVETPPALLLHYSEEEKSGSSEDQTAPYCTYSVHYIDYRTAQFVPSVVHLYRK